MPVPHGFVERLAELSHSGTPFVCVTMVEAVGSTPQDAGSKMLVTADGLAFGTVGGGRVEAKAIGVAKGLLAGRPEGETRRQGDKEQERSGHESPCLVVSRSPCLLLEWNLKRDVGMTCGGTVKLYFETYNHAVWRIVLFGAGHVAAAVAECLRQLECHVTCIDPRAEWLDKISDRPRLRKIRADEPRSLVAELPADAFVICMTMGHATDRPILEEIFRQGKAFPFLGVIGSRAKRAVLVKELIAAGIATNVAEQFHCPIGLDIGTNQPGEIAVSVVAQLIQQRDKWRSVQAESISDFGFRIAESQNQSAIRNPQSAILLHTRRFDVVEQTVTRADGRTASVQFVKHNGSAAILPLVDDDHVCLIKSRRLTVNEWLIEIPAGTREPDEPPPETARRELIEETGYRAGRLEELIRYYPSPGVLSEMMHVFVARDLTPGDHAREDNEEIENFVVSIDEALTMIDSGEIHDGKTIAALLVYQRKRGATPS
jgi:xanthine dehydrogenase accessory factor